MNIVSEYLKYFNSLPLNVQVAFSLDCTNVWFKHSFIKWEIHLNTAFKFF